MTTEEKEKNIDDFLEMLATPDEFGIPIDPEVFFRIAKPSMKNIKLCLPSAPMCAGSLWGCYPDSITGLLN